MATNCTIGYIDKDSNEYKIIYVHYDGGFNHTGEILFEKYNSYKKAKDLVSLNHLQQVNKEINQCIKLEDAEDFKQEPKPSRNYNYLFKNNEWYYIENNYFNEKTGSFYNENNKWKKLSNIFNENINNIGIRINDDFVISI